jgi:hypothetical protein
MIKTGGVWDPTDRHIVFAASNPTVLKICIHNKNVLAPMDRLAAEGGVSTIDQFVEEGRNVFVDSGIFNLAMEHARQHDCSMNEALALAPDAIDGFDDLMEKYLAIVGEAGDRCWGYIEMDQGGRENKIKTRAFLESKGLRPIPVYHPLNDGWDYFDELAQNYDRICLGNIVQADQKTRVRLLTTVLKRRQAYPNLWIHGLGMAPVPYLMSLHLDSVDASTFLFPVRWSKWPVTAAMTKAVLMPEEFKYRLDSESESPMGHHELKRLLGFDLVAHQRHWRAHVRRQAEESTA